ncbi:hypothetical protein [Rhodanobacter umsongensis]
MQASGDIAARHPGSAWYRQPVLWLGIAVFVFSLVGCVWIIVAGVRHADTPVQTPHTVFGVPVSAHGRTVPPPSDPPR